jgi:GNAT superfamily N-acetyltransferase
MELKVVKTVLDEIRDLRILFLNEGNFQFVCNKCHDYGWADTYLIFMDGIRVGYGSVWGTDKREDRDTIFEFYVLRPYRKFSNLIFPEFIKVSKPLYIEGQSNDLLLSSMLYEHSELVRPEAILFEDHTETSYHFPGIIFRKRTDSDEMGDDDSDYVLVKNDAVIASGGLMLNYNMPYADIYMQVKEPFRGQGLGSLIVQELKKAAYATGRVPAARCNINNQRSKATLLKAGLNICGYRLKGEVKKSLYLNS